MLLLPAVAAARGIRLVEVEGDEAAFLELNEIDGGGGMDDINELDSVFPFDLMAMPSDNSVIGAMLTRRPQICFVIGILSLFPACRIGLTLFTSRFGHHISIFPVVEGIDDLEALSSTVSGKPGRDYPIYSAAPNTSFSCDGLENGGHWAIYLKCHFI